MPDTFDSPPQPSRASLAPVAGNSSSAQAESAKRQPSKPAPASTGVGALVPRRSRLMWPILLLGLTAAVTLAVGGPRWIESAARVRFEQQQVLLAANAAHRLGARVEALQARLSDPLIWKGSGLLDALGAPGALQGTAAESEALARLYRKGDRAQGVGFHLRDASGQVVATAAGELPVLAKALRGHKHHSALDTVAHCGACRSPGRMFLATPLPGGLQLVAHLQMDRFAGEALADTMDRRQGGAWLLNARGQVLHEVGGLARPISVEERASLRPPTLDPMTMVVGDASLPGKAPSEAGDLRVRVAAPLAALAQDVRQSASRLIRLSVLVVVLVLALGVVGITRERRRHAQALRNLALLSGQEKLVTLGTLAASLGHEIRNILTIAISGIELAQLEAKGRQRKALERVGVALDRLTQLSKDLLRGPDASGEGGRVVLAGVVEEALRLVTPRLKHGPALELSLDPRVAVRGKASLLGQLVMNLVLNAADALEGYVPQGPATIWLELVREDNDAVLRIRDNGPGLPEGLEVEVFEAFFSTKGNSKADRGSGLGLWLSRQVAESSGGSLRLMPCQGSGACFELRLPVIRAGAGLLEAAA